VNDPIFSRLHIFTLTATLVMICVFVSFPGLDLAIAGLVYEGAGRFMLTASWLANTVNDTLRIGLSAGYLAILLAILLWKLLRITPESGFANWGFAITSFLIGPGLIVNGILKSWVGRARPAHLVEFGGSKAFTPMLEISDQCGKNCSFSSGEVAQTSTFVFTALVLAWPHLSRNGRWVWSITGASLICLSIFLRIGLGRHFLSDALTSVAISAMVALAMYRLFNVGMARERLTWVALLRDLSAMGGAFTMLLLRGGRTTLSLRSCNPPDTTGSRD